MATKLIYGCSYSEIWVHPKNWKTAKSKKDLNKNWYVECKYYDPDYIDKYPKGFPYRKKLNRFKTLKERKEAAEILFVQIKLLFEEKLYNPITKKYMKPKTASSDKLGEMWIVESLEATYPYLPITDITKKDIRSTVNSFHRVAKKLYPALMTKDVHSGHIRDILDFMDISNNRFNKHLSYLSIVFNELVEKLALFHNPIRDIRKRKTVKKVRKILDIKEFKNILDILEKDHYTFYLYTMIFFYSGSRSSELMKLQVKDVDLRNQEYKIVIQKGKEYVETMKAIIKPAVPFWKEVISKAKSKNDYVFSKGLVPGPNSIKSYQITKRWKRLVKEKYGIQEDFYALKHLFLDLMDSKIENNELNLSSKLASHTTPGITNSVYLVNRKKREMEMLKNVDIRI